MSLRGHHISPTVIVDTASFLVVRLGSSYIALPADGVRGVLTEEEAGQEQTVTVSGTIYQVIDLAREFSAGADWSGQDVRSVLYSNGRSQGAIRVEQVVGLSDVERKDCLPLPPQFRSAERNWFRGMMLYQDQLVLIVNPSWALGELTDAVPVSMSHVEQLVSKTPSAVGGPC